MASLLSRRQPPRGQYTPQLWSVWVVAPLALLVVGALSFGLYHGVYGLLADAARSQKPPKSVDINDVVKTTVTVLTLTGAVLAGIYAYRKQLLSEGDAHRADASQLANRYTTAAEQLGHDQAAVRLAGVYALARLAEDWEEQRQVCIDVLCAYLRMPYEPESTADGHKVGEREVRLTIIRVIRDHLQEPDNPSSWCECSFDFTGTTFDGGDFSGAHFLHLTIFREAKFSHNDVYFSRATFSNGMTSFDNATFNGSNVSFDNVTVSDDGMVTFNNATFSAGRISFSRATLSGGNINFYDATLNGGRIDFRHATLGDGDVTFYRAFLIDGDVNFHRAKLQGGNVDFSHARLNGGNVNFHNATFDDGDVRFDNLALNDGILNFYYATFNGSDVKFDNAIFSGGTAHFNDATFNSGAVSFNNATFSGTAINWGPFPQPSGA
ncbi:pentapeptide repeat-containing protein [Streptomyces sp. P5_D11]